MGASVQFGRGQGWVQSAAIVTLAIGGTVSMATPAQAACTPGAVDATTPAPGTTVTCTGNTVNQNVDAGYGTGNQTGITINVGDGASVESVGRIGIWVGDAVIRNGLGASVLGRTNGIDAATGSLAVTNYGSITGTNGVGISASAGAASVINSGTISSTNGTGITASSNVTLTNQAGGAVRGAVDGVVSTAGAITVDNAGNITGTNAAAIDALTDITVTNRAGGVISGGTRGIFSRGGNITIDNAGSITSTGGVATVSAGFDSVKLINRAGASIGGSVVAFKAVDVENAGDIGGIFGQNVRVVNTATGTIGSIASIAGADIVNFGNMTDVRTSGTLVNHAGGNTGLLLGLGGLAVTNSGPMGGVGNGFRIGRSEPDIGLPFGSQQARGGRLLRSLEGAEIADQPDRPANHRLAADEAAGDQLVEQAGHLDRIDREDP